MRFLRLIYCITIQSIFTPFHCYNPRFRSMSAKRTISSFFKPSEPKPDIKKPKLDAEIVSAETDDVTITDNTSSSSSKIVSSSSIVTTNQVNSTLSNISSTSSTLTTLMNNLEDGWKLRLSKELNKTYFKSLDKFLQTELNNVSKTVFPPPEDIFSAFHYCPFEAVKVVIIGQDPYHGPGQAHGLCFSVRKGVPPPPSLKNIFIELKNDPELKVKTPTHGCLDSWARQGVLLLNTCMTVRQGEANSHQKQGWEDFTDAVVREVGAHRTDVVYLLWGQPARKKVENNHIDRSRNHIITCSHPSPLGAYKTDEPFMGSKCFSRCNSFLLERGQEPIDWNIK